MKEKITFGEYLSQLLKLRSWSAAKLARMINLDPSYVQKWVRGDRVPALQSNHISNIVKALTYGIDNKHKKGLFQLYINLLVKSGYKIDNINSIDLLIITLENALKETQVYSLTLDVSERKCVNIIETDKVIKSLSNINFSPTSSDLKTKKFEIEFNNMPNVLHGKKNILKGIISLFRKASEDRNNTKLNIMMTFQSEKNIISGCGKNLASDFKKSLIDALNKGYKLTHLSRLNQNITRTFNIVKDIISFVSKKVEYMPLYLEKYGLVSPANELIIVENIGAIVCYGTKELSDIDTAFVIKDKAGIKALINHFDLLLNSASELLEIYESEEQIYKRAVNTDKCLSNMYSYGCSLNHFTYSYDIWEKYLKKFSKDNSIIKPHLKRIKLRYKAFFEQITNYKYYNILSKKAITHLISKESYLSKIKYQKPEKQDIIDHIKNIIYLLENYDNYSIAFVNDDFIDSKKVSWEVKQNHSVILGYNNYDKTKENVNIKMYITEDTIVNSFSNYFEFLWEKASPYSKDKEQNIKWLKEQIKWYQSKTFLKNKLIKIRFFLGIM
ncbi:MAG: helix-turn-helix transcriptional regulator [Firmicutes bacterium]|nr:helix-turn-helix transcriptional regulator [Bacillota bacterium]